MGKEKSTTDLACHNSNDAKKTIEENKENSLKDKNSIQSDKKTKNSSKLNSKKSEVLEDDNSNDSSTSTDTKASSSSSNNSSSTSASKETSTSKSKTSSLATDKATDNKQETEEKVENPAASEDKTSDDKTSDDKTSDDKTSDDKTSDDKTSEDKKEEPQFRVASNNTGFKLRIVPLEKLLEKPKQIEVAKEKKRSASPPLKKKNERFVRSARSSRDNPVRRLPERARKPTSFVVISESESEEETSERSKSESESSGEEPPPTKKVAKVIAAKFKSKPRPPSPSTVRRCVVKIKRSKLSDFKNLKSTTNKKTKMNGGTEKPSTSAARRKPLFSDNENDSDSDVRVSDVEDNADEDEEEASQRDSSDSEVIPTRKRRVFNRGKKSDNSDEDFEPDNKSKKKKRRIRKNSTDDSDDDDDEKKDKTKRKDIRKIIKTSELNISTKTATKEEEERRKRIEERQKLYNQIYEKPDSVEVDELVLDFDPESRKTLLEVDKGLMKKLKPHQVTGVKFMWDACFETIEDAQEKPGSGCILAHCMGLGKTMQIVTLSHTLLANSKKTNVERVLIISPLSTLNNWAREFKHWISFTRKRNIEIYDMSKYKDKNTRIFKLNEWFEEGGVCIMGYDMYRILTNEKAKGLRKKQREQLQQSLVDPGPDLVVCDEGHLLKNEKTSISKAVTRMRTLRRIVLTGTPLQNNLKEYYCMIQFIKPNLLGTYKEYLNRFVNPISNGQYTDSTERDIRLMKHRSHILHQLLQGCIQRRDYSVLAPYLPPKHEYVVYTTLSTLQQLLYEHYMTYQRDVGGSISEGKGARLFQDFQELRRIWTHPMNMRINSDSVIRKKVLANDNDSMDDFLDDNDDDDDDEPAGAGSSSESSVGSSKSFGSGGGGGRGAPSKSRKTRNFRREAAAAGVDVDSDIEELPPVQQDDPSEWWKRFVADKELNNVNHSPKLVMLMRLLEQCEQIGDKLLVFSQSLQSLDTIEHFLSLVDSKTRGYEYEGDVGDFSGFWNNGTDYFRLDGSCSVEQRESMCKRFNDSTNLRARLFLISTRAGGLGINLVSANRVVIFDVSWNPSHDTQSIFRVYRFGQVKPCYIYRLIAMGTMEQKLYERQVAKQATAKRVIDEQQISRHYNQSDLLELYTYELQPTVPREIPILPKDRLFAELLSEHEKLLFKYHEHDSLLENEESENLSESERKEAWSEFEAEKTRTVQTAQFMAYDRSAYGGQFGNASGSVTSNKIFGFRSDVLLQLLNMKIAQDHPEMTQNQVIQVVPTYLNQLYSQMNGGDPTMYKDLLSLHGTLAHPSGMYMNPLLYVNQNPQAAGYFQGQAANGVAGSGAGVGLGVGGAQIVPNPAAQAAAAPPRPAPGFDPNEVYEID
ncbi:transcriptional regulator ATRX homolog [Calliphora vicina]|uniref:transcriptional regulator ATRX homolog n=1 Tax=Calliphora vicina TaxID=7373 RepID=UPI00325BDAAA